MARTHLYLAIEDIALSAGQRAALVEKMRALGPGRFVLARPENVERVKADFEKRQRRGG